MLSPLVAMKMGVVALEFLAGTGPKARAVGAATRAMVSTDIFIVRIVLGFELLSCFRL